MGSLRSTIAGLGVRLICKHYAVSICRRLVADGRLSAGCDSSSRARGQSIPSRKRQGIKPRRKTYRCISRRLSILANKHILGKLLDGRLSTNCRAVARGRQVRGSIVIGAPARGEAVHGRTRGLVA